jgi:hypothetical protein
VLSGQLEALHLWRRTVDQEDTDLEPRFSEGVLNLTFPKLHSFSIDGRNVYFYGPTATEFWQRHPGLRYLEVWGDVRLPIIPSLDEDTLS